MKKYTSRFVASASLLALIGITPLSALAVPLVDFEAKANYWQADYEGKIGANTTLTLNDLGFEEKSTQGISLRLEHPVPVLPNIKFQSTPLKNKATATLSASQVFDIDGTNFGNETINSSLDLSHRDLSLYYSIAWFDIGLTGRDFDTSSTFTGATTGTTEVKLDGTIPMLYAGLGVDLPFTGLYVNAELNWISVDESSFQDIQGAIGYKFGGPVKLGTELGYRRMGLNLEGFDDFDAELTIDGWYLSLGLLL